MSWNAYRGEDFQRLIFKQCKGENFDTSDIYERSKGNISISNCTHSTYFGLYGLCKYYRQDSIALS